MNKQLKYENLLEEVLENLGNRTSKILKNIIGLDIKYNPEVNRFCPIAEYLKKKIVNVSGVSVEDDFIYIAIKDNNNRLQIRIETPSIIKTFIKNFDKGDYDNEFFT